MCLLSFCLPACFLFFLSPFDGFKLLLYSRPTIVLFTCFNFQPLKVSYSSKIDEILIDIILKFDVRMNEWQSAPMKTKPKRAFIGNLNNHPDIEQKVRELFSRSAITIQSIEVVPLKQPNTKCYALVQCDIGMAIKCLDGMRFEGNVLNVKSEKKDASNGRKKKGMGFGGGWAAPKSSNPQPHRNNNGKGGNKVVKPHNHSTIQSCNMENSANAALSARVSKMGIKSNEAVPTKKPDEISSFHARCKVSLNELMKGYGAYDPDYEKMKSLNAEDAGSQSQSNFVPNAPQKATNDLQSDDYGMLAPYGKAPIHIELVSFGFKYSVPSQAREGWSHSNPLSPIDCRDLPRCPHYVAKLSGLSHKVKRAMLSATAKYDDINDDEDVDSEEIKGDVPGINPLLAKSEEASMTVLNSIEEAINDGGHGYAFPLETIIYVGSEYGRHRSVVLCEKMAQNIRNLLRANTDAKISQPVSVSTRHRDVDQKHKDEEAFGTDLRREHDVEMKRKKRQEWLESGW